MPEPPEATGRHSRPAESAIPAMAPLPRWMPGVYHREQHWVTTTPACCQWISACGDIVADYPTDDPRVQWTRWERCRQCAPMALARAALAQTVRR